MIDFQRALISRRHLLRQLALAVLALAGFAWATRALAEAAANPKATRIACVGDSITYGAGLQNRTRDAYPFVLGRMLGADWEVRDFGVSGATLLRKGDRPYHLQKDHDQALAYAPDIVVIMLGTNDSKHRGDGSLEADKAIDNWQHKGDYVADYETLIAEFRKVNPAVKVYVCLPTPCFPGRWGIDDKTIHEEIIPMVRQVAADTHAEIIDLYTPLTGRKELFPDTVHPNAGGEHIMAVTVYQALTGKPAPAE